jgi:hypothetical protein
VRARYWDEALKVHANSTLVGTGAGAYATVRNRYRDNGDIIVRHAHGYGVQTLSDLGWIGLGLSLLAALAWVLTAARTVGLRRGDRGLRFDAERAALWTMATVVVIFGLHSAIDWTWFVPGNVVPALLCAGWVAGRGPLRERLLEQTTPAHTPWPESTITGAHTAALEGAPPTYPEPAGPFASLRSRLPRWAPPPGRAAGALLAVVLALAAAWAAYQPVRSVHAGDQALERLEQGAFEPAASIAQIAVDRNPLAVDPLFELAAIQQARGQTPEALRALEKAVDVQPANAETWRRLGRFRLDTLAQPRRALDDFQVAYYLDPQNRQSWSDLIYATRAVEADGG